MLNLGLWLLQTESCIGGLVHLQTSGHVQIIQPTQAEIVGAAGSHQISLISAGFLPSSLAMPRYPEGMYEWEQ